MTGFGQTNLRCTPSTMPRLQFGSSHKESVNLRSDWDIGEIISYGTTWVSSIHFTHSQCWWCGSLALYVVNLMLMHKLQTIIVAMFIRWPPAAWKSFRARWVFVFRVYFSSPCAVGLDLLGGLRQPLVTTYVTVPGLAVVTFPFFLLSLSIIRTTTPAVRVIHLWVLLDLQ